MFSLDKAFLSYIQYILTSVYRRDFVFVAIYFILKVCADNGLTLVPTGRILVTSIKVIIR